MVKKNFEIIVKNWHLFIFGAGLIHQNYIKNKHIKSFNTKNLLFIILDIKIQKNEKKIKIS